MFTTILLVAIVANSGVNNLKDWTVANTSMELALLTISLVDVMQTRYFLNCDPYGPIHGDEANPLLGKHPSALKLYVGASAAVALHAIIAKLLPNEGPREIWQAIGITVETIVVTHNYKGMGFRMKLRF